MRAIRKQSGIESRAAALRQRGWVFDGPIRESGIEFPSENQEVAWVSLRGHSREVLVFRVRIEIRGRKPLTGKATRA